MKTIIARFTELKENVDDSGEDLESMDFNKVDKALKSVGVQLKDTTGSFRNLDDVFLELSSKWDTLTRNQQRYIATIAAGSRQQSRFIAMMEDYERTIELVETAQNSTGRSDEQFAKYADTITFKLNQIKNSWEELRVSFLNEKDYKIGLDFVNDFLNSIKNINPKTLILDTAIFAIIARNIVTNLITSLKTNTPRLTTEFNNFMNSATKPINKIGTKIGNSITDAVLLGTKKAKRQLYNELSNVNINIGYKQLTTESVNILRNLSQANIELRKVTSETQIITGLSQQDAHNLDHIILQLNNRGLSEQEIANALLKQEYNQEKIELNNEQINSLNRDNVDKVIQLALKHRDVGKELQKQKQLLQEQGISARNLGNLTNEELQALIKKTDQLNKFSQGLNNALNRLGSAASSAITAGLTAGITTGLSTGDWSGAITVGLSAAGAAALPAIISLVTDLTISALVALNPVALGAVITVVVIGALAIAIKKARDYFSVDSETRRIQKETKKTEEQLKKLKKMEDELGSQVSETKSNEKEKKDELAYLEKINKAQEDYIKKTIHTVAEQEEYNELLNEVGEKYPELIHGEELQVDALKEKIDAQKESLKLVQETALAQELAVAANQQQQADQKMKQAQLNADSIDALMFTNLLDDSYSDRIKGTVGGELNFIEDSLKEIGSTKIADLYGDHFSTETKMSMTAALTEGMEAVNSLTEQQKEAILDTYNKNKNKSFKSINDISQLQDQYDFLQYVQDITQFTDKAESLLKNYLSDAYKEYSKESRAIEELSENTAYNALYDFYIAQGKTIAEAEYYAEQNKKKAAQLLTKSDIDFSNISDWTESNWNEVTEITTSAANSYQQSLNENLVKAIDDLDTSKLSADLYNKYERIFNRSFKDLNEEFEIEIDGQIFKIDNENDFEFLKSALSTVGSEMQTLREQAENLKLNDIFDINKLDLDVLKSFVSQFDTFFENIPDSAEDAVIKSLKKLKNNYNLDDELFKTLFSSVDWTNINPAEVSNYIDGLQKIIDESGIIIVDEKGKEIGNKFGKIFYDEMTETLAEQEAISISYESDEKFEEDIEQMTENIDKIIESSESIYQIATKSGELTASELKSFQEWAKENEINWTNYYDTVTHSLKNTTELFNIQSQLVEKSLKEIDLRMESLTKGNEKNLALYTQLLDKKEKGLLTGEEEKQLYQDLEDSVGPIYKEWKELYDLRESKSAEAYAQEKEYLNAVIDDLKEIKKDAEDAEKALNEALETQQKEEQEAIEKINEALKEKQEKQLEAIEKINDALKDVTEQEETILEKEQAIVDKTQELNDALYGTSNYLSKRDSLQNYSDRLDQLSSAAEKAKNALDNPEIGDNIAELVKNYGEAIHQEMVYQQALNQRKEDQKNQILGYLQGFGSEYFSMVDGYLQANYSVIDNAQMNDQLKDQIYQYLDDYNKVQKEIIDGENKYNDLLKEMKERRKSALSDMVNLQKDTAEILKESYEKEIEDIKEKYDAIKEADNEYLDALQEAIDKQRKLRDEEDKWNDLATKEKKLSLISRDTSGSQQKETLKLQEEIEKDRQSLLDSSIDNILETLKETYEEQQKEREEELEYQEQMIEDMDFMKQAMEIIQSMDGSSENYLAWLMQNDPEYLEGSPLEQELYLEEHANDLAPFEEYAAITNSNFQNYLNITADEVSQVMAQTSDNMNEYLERSHQNTLDKVQEEQDAAQEALNQAYEDLDEAKLKLEELHEKVNEAYENYDTVIKETQEKVNEAHENQKKVIDENITKVNEAQTAYNEAMKKVHDAGASSINDMTRIIQQVESEQSSILASHDKDLMEYTTKWASILASVGEEGLAARISEYDKAVDFQKQVDDAFNNSFNSRGEQEYNDIVESMKNSATHGDASAAQWLIDNNKDDYINSRRAEIAEKAIGDISGMIAQMNPNLEYYTIQIDSDGKTSLKLNRYATGGLVNYTGPAWVDGSPTRPEAFLSAEDTARIGAAAQLLSNIPALNSSSITDNSYSSNIGDTTIEVHINVENISSEVDIDEAVKRVENDIVEMSNSIGNPILLNK